MIKLIVDNTNQVSILEAMLIEHGIDYTVEERTSKGAINPPYLIVHGAPLDFAHAIRWICEK